MKEISSYRELTENPNDAPIESGINYLYDEKQKILDYFKKYNTPDIVITCGIKDFITGEESHKESVKCFNDGIYYWTNLEIYHFEKYNLKLNADFIQHVLNC